MPLLEIKPPQEANWIRIYPRCVVISKSLRTGRFLDGRVGVYIDIENSILGLKPQKTGYKLDKKGKIWISSLHEYRIKYLEYPAEWSDRHEMITAKIERHTETTK